SDELAETASVLFRQLHSLDIAPERVFISIPREESRIVDIWGTEPGGKQMSTRFEADTDATWAFRQVRKGWEEKKPEFAVVLKGKHLEEHINQVTNQMHIPFRKELAQGQRILYCTYFSRGFFVTITPEAQPEETRNILQRFAAVFDQTYTRFLDLERAEAQAREGQIQLGLERVRAKAMSMQNSDELNALVGTVFEELTKLDFILTRCLIMIFDPATLASRWWMANSEVPEEPANYLVQNHNYPAYLAYLKAWHGRILQWQYALKGKVKRDWDDFLFVDTELSGLPGVVIEGMKAPEEVLLTASFNNFGCLTLVSMEPLSDEHTDILLRFANVFDMSYTRFNDLKQAEAQAREGQIQLGLERVRARAMAMQTSEELNALVGTVFEELTKLDLVLTRCAIMIFDPETLDSRWWMVNSEATAEPVNFFVPNNDNTPYQAYLGAWRERALVWHYELKGKVKRDWDEYLFADTELSRLPLAVIEGMKAPEKVFWTASFNNFGCLRLVSMKPLSDEHTDILLRFAKVFDMS
ncbi:MAG TPA: hypothetical protein VHS53_12140, partial [Mucilaginibacter sp.]|nr:hypothetical protein [Mucilaginibacter sp.]